jgi:hypothetical protein
MLAGLRDANADREGTTAFIKDLPWFAGEELTTKLLGKFNGMIETPNFAVNGMRWSSTMHDRETWDFFFDGMCYISFANRVML